MLFVLLVIHMMIAAALVGIVLLQKSEGGALGIGGGGGGGGFMTGRGQANFLTRTTSILGGAFFLTSLLLTYFAQSGPKGSLLEQLGGDKPAATAPATPGESGTAGDKPADAPATGGPSLLDKLKSGNAPLER